MRWSPSGLALHSSKVFLAMWPGSPMGTRSQWATWWGGNYPPSASKPLFSFGLFMKRTRADSHGFHARQYTINGIGITAKNWVEALEQATLRTNLRLLTLLPFENVLNRHVVSRRTRAWCPACYEGWRSAGDVIYEPLLWAIRRSRSALGIADR